MSYIFKFNNNDKIVNFVKTYPRISYAIYNGTSSYSNQYSLSGAFTSSVLSVPSGYISLYELSIDRTGTLDFGNTDLTNAPWPTPKDPFSYAVAVGIDPTTFYTDTHAGISSPQPVMYYEKDGTRLSFKTATDAQYNLSSSMGDVLYEDYPLSASITKAYYTASAQKYATSSHLGSDIYETGSVTHLYALKNTLEFHQTTNPNYAFSSSVRDLGASGSEGDRYAGTDIINNIAQRKEGIPTDTSLISVPTIFYGDTIKKGTVDLRFYVSGTLIGQLQDSTRNGDLVQIGPAGSEGSGSSAGLVLYDEGFIILTGSWDLSAGQHREDYTGSTGAPNWIGFGAQSFSGSTSCPSSSFFLDFSGSTTTPVMTLFATAPKGQLNHSNNPTYIKSGSVAVVSTGSTGYTENREREIKNTVSSSYADPTGSFHKTTYISKIGIYDKNKNLIAIAKMATPVKKTGERDLTFKLKLDL